jgi:hypothetical protein
MNHPIAAGSPVGDAGFVRRESGIASGTVNSSASSTSGERRSERVATRVSVEIAVASMGAALVMCAVAANQGWLDRHFLPSWFLPRRWYVPIEQSVRLLIGLCGLSLALVVRRRVARFATRAPGYVLLAAIAAVLALGAGELTVRRVHVRAADRAKRMAYRIRRRTLLFVSQP